MTVHILDTQVIHARLFGVIYGTTDYQFGMAITMKPRNQQQLKQFKTYKSQ